MINANCEEISFASPANLKRLHDIWKYHDKKQVFELRRSDWPPETFDLLELLQKSNPELIEAWPHRESRDEHGQATIMSVRLKPEGLKLLQEQPREVKRQITVNGQRVDLRNSKNHLLMTAPIENLEAVAPLWLNDFKTEQDIRVHRALRMKLQNLLAYRQHELSLSTRDQIVSTLMSHSKPSHGCPTENAERREE